jgi:hypothetical protein
VETEKQMTRLAAKFLFVALALLISAHIWLSLMPPFGRDFGILDVGHAIFSCAVAFPAIAIFDRYWPKVDRGPTE